MAHILKVIEIGDEVGVVIPEDILSRWLRSEGDTIYLTESDNSFTLSPDDPSARRA